MGVSAVVVSILSSLTAEWDLGTFLQNSSTTLQTWGGYFFALVGVIMIIVGIYQIAKGFISHGKTQTNWFIAIALLVIGGALLVGGWSWVAGIAKGGKKTIDDLGNGTGDTIIPMLRSFF